MPGPDADPDLHPDPRPTSALDRWRASLHEAASSPRPRLAQLADRVPAVGRAAALGALVLVVVGAVVATVLVLVGISASPNRPPASVASRSDIGGPGGSDSTTSSAPPGSTGTTDGSSIVVAVAGAVAAPGVVRLVGGGRVADALAAAGGVDGAADTDRLNLAAPLHDGDRVYVPRRGEGDTPVVVEPDGGDRAGTGGATATTRPPPVDINRASADELDALPGIGPSTAAAIVDYRDQHGPFRSLDDLAQVRGIGPAKLEQLRPLVKL